jgi:hypothetical protein
VPRRGAGTVVVVVLPEQPAVARPPALKRLVEDPSEVAVEALVDELEAAVVEAVLDEARVLP